MKYAAWLAAAWNLWIGGRMFLNTIHVLHDSKYSQGATAAGAVLLLAGAAAGLWFSIARGDARTALLVGLAPWAAGFVIALVSLLTGRQQ